MLLCTKKQSVCSHNRKYWLNPKDSLEKRTKIKIQDLKHESIKIVFEMENNQNKLCYFIEKAQEKQQQNEGNSSCMYFY